MNKGITFFNFKVRQHIQFSNAIKLIIKGTCHIQSNGLILHLILQSDMFTSILRIGPFVILESILLIIATIIYFFQTLPQCYTYTLTQLAFIFFLIEMYASLCIMKKSSRLRKLYIKSRIQQSKPIFYTRLIWDNLNLILIIMLLYSALVADGLRLASNQKTMDADSNSPNTEECKFVLFSISLFSQLLEECSFSSEDSMIVWMLYAATTFLISIICIIVSKEYYHYCSSLHHNRRFSMANGGMNEALLDCSIYRISAATTIDQTVRDTLGECSICLDGLLEKEEMGGESKIVMLSCKHHFHEECIQKWVKVKDHCPYRCFLDEK